MLPTRARCNYLSLFFYFFISFVQSSNRLLINSAVFFSAVPLIGTQVATYEEIIYQVMVATHNAVRCCSIALYFILSAYHAPCLLRTASHVATNYCSSSPSSSNCFLRFPHCTSSSLFLSLLSDFSHFPSSHCFSTSLPLHQVFLRDKRSAMRLHNPLPNRSVVRADVAAE